MLQRATGAAGTTVRPVIPPLLTPCAWPGDLAAHRSCPSSHPARDTYHPAAPWPRPVRGDPRLESAATARSCAPRALLHLAPHAARRPHRVPAAPRIRGRWHHLAWCAPPNLAPTLARRSASSCYDLRAQQRWVLHERCHDQARVICLGEAASRPTPRTGVAAVAQGQRSARVMPRAMGASTRERDHKRWKRARGRGARLHGRSQKA